MSALAGLVAGFLVWSSAFVALYGLHAVGCNLGWQAPETYASPLRLALVAVWLLHAAALVWLVLHFRPAAAASSAPFLERAAFTLSALALAVTLITGAPILALDLCR
jgi:hypothetical protein